MILDGRGVELKKVQLIKSSKEAAKLFCHRDSDFPVMMGLYWDVMGWNGIGWDGTGWDETGWDGLGSLGERHG